MRIVIGDVRLIGHPVHTVEDLLLWLWKECQQTVRLRHTPGRALDRLGAGRFEIRQSDSDEAVLFWRRTQQLHYRRLPCGTFLPALLPRIQRLNIVLRLVSKTVFKLKSFMMTMYCFDCLLKAHCDQEAHHDGGDVDKEVAP